MIPKQYKEFCEMKHSIIACNYVNHTDCPGTCNLAQEYLAKQDMPSELEIKTNERSEE